MAAHHTSGVTTGAAHPQTVAGCGRGMIAVAMMATLLAGCASLGPPSTPDSLPEAWASRYTVGDAVSQIPGFRLSGWEYVDEWHIVVDAGPREPYLVTFAYPCRDLQDAHTLAHTRRLGALSEFDRILARSPMGPVDCRIQRLQRLQPVAPAAASS